MAEQQDMAAELAEAKRLLKDLCAKQRWYDKVFAEYPQDEDQCGQASADLGEAFDDAEKFLTRPAPSPPANEVGRLRHAANCALWLLEQDQLRPLVDGVWGDPQVIRDMLREAGCVPSCAALTPAPVADGQDAEDTRQPGERDGDFPVMPDAARHGSEGGG